MMCDTSEYIIGEGALSFAHKRCFFMSTLDDNAYERICMSDSV